MVKRIVYSLSLLVLFYLIVLTPIFASNIDGIEYSTHVENVGWQEYVNNGYPAGTTGLGLRLEGIKIRLINPTPDVGVQYRTHVENIGWQDWVDNDKLSGTEGQALRLEAISIRLFGDGSSEYNVFYHVHAQDVGWMGWTSNGQDSGTAGMSKRLEAIEILVLPADQQGPTDNVPAFIENHEEQPDNNSPIHFKTYIAGAGWPNHWGVNGEAIGSGNINSIEAIQIGLNDAMRAQGGIIYKELSTLGWTDWIAEGDVAGRAGDPIQGLRIKLTGKLGFTHDVYYRLHTNNVGWTNLAKNGEACGSEGLGRPTSLVQIWITEKGEQPNAPWGNSFTDTTWYWPLDGYRSLSTYFGTRGASHHDGIDIPAPEGTPIHSAKSGVVKYIGYADGLNHSLLYGAFGNCVCIEHDSGEICYYAHMSAFNTAVDARVQKGQVIGFVGTTGNSLGNHLHFEVYNSGGNLVDPLGFYPQ